MFVDLNNELGKGTAELKREDVLSEMSLTAHTLPLSRTLFIVLHIHTSELPSTARLCVVVFMMMVTEKLHCSSCSSALLKDSSVTDDGTLINFSSVVCSGIVRRSSAVTFPTR